MAATSHGKNHAPATATAEGPAKTAAGAVIFGQEDHDRSTGKVRI
jgi:hypothetical protein